MSDEAMIVPPHMSSEFYTWLWYSAEANEAVFKLPEPIGKIELWMDERLTFRRPDGAKPETVMTGDNPSVAKEARAALAGGKIVHDLQIHIRRDDREFRLVLDGTTMGCKRAKLPQAIEGSGEEALADRMFLYEEVQFMLLELFKQFAEIRTSKMWQKTVVPKIRAWIVSEE